MMQQKLIFSKPHLTRLISTVLVNSLLPGGPVVSGTVGGCPHLPCWSKRSACDHWSNLGRPLFLVINLSFFLLYIVLKIPEGVVVGFPNVAWAPNSQKYKDSNGK